MSTITWTYSANSATIALPEYNYYTDVIMNMKRCDSGDGTLSWWDNTATYDTRICTATFLLDETDHNEFLTWYNDNTKGRGNTVTLNVGSDSNFHPFGPDYGDTGSFTCNIIDYIDGGILYRPWKCFRTKVTFVLVASPNYTAADQVSEGNFYIGTVTGLRYPQTEFAPYHERAAYNVLTNDGSAQVLDMSTDADQYNTKFLLEANEGNTAAILDYITDTARGAAFEIDNDSDVYPWGGSVTEGNGSTVTCKLNNNIVRCTHTRHAGWQTQFDLRLDGVA